MFAPVSNKTRKWATGALKGLCGIRKPSVESVHTWAEQLWRHTAGVSQSHHLHIKSGRTQKSMFYFVFWNGYSLSSDPVFGCWDVLSNCWLWHKETNHSAAVKKGSYDSSQPSGSKDQKTLKCGLDIYFIWWMLLMTSNTSFQGCFFFHHWVSTWILAGGFYCQQPQWSFWQRS